MKKEKESKLSLQQIEKKLSHLNFDPSQRERHTLAPEVLAKSQEYLQGLAKPKPKQRACPTSVARHLFLQVKEAYESNGMNLEVLDLPLKAMLYSVTGSEKLINYAEMIKSDILVQSLGKEKESLISPEKGFLVIGQVGAGKTMLVNTLRMIANKLQRQFPEFGMGPMMHAGKMCVQYEKEGAGVMDSWTRGNVVIDELGADKVSSKYGNSMNPVEQWLMTDRYDAFVNHKTKTHVISNISSCEELADKYDTRTLDRFVQMFNVIDMMDVESFRV